MGELNAGLRAYQEWRREVNLEGMANMLTARLAWEARAPEREAEAKVAAKAYKAAAHAKRRTDEIQRTPAWVDRAAIKAVYLEAARLTKKTGIPHHVDHVIPLRGRKVSGLHVAENLRAVPWHENLRKHNHFEPS